MVDLSIASKVQDKLDELSDLLEVNHLRIVYDDDNCQGYLVEDTTRVVPDDHPDITDDNVYYLPDEGVKVAMPLEPFSWDVHTVIKGE